MLMQDAPIPASSRVLSLGVIVSGVRHGLIDRVAACFEGTEGAMPLWRHAQVLITLIQGQAEFRKC